LIILWLVVEVAAEHTLPQLAVVVVVVLLRFYLGKRFQLHLILLPLQRQLVPTLTAITLALTEPQDTAAAGVAV
jgi:hypothetical protein